MKLKIVNNFTVLGHLLALITLSGCAPYLMMQDEMPKDNLGDYNMLAVAKSDFECKGSMLGKDIIWSINKDDTFGTVDIQNAPVFDSTKFKNANRLRGFPPHTVGVLLRDYEGEVATLALYPDGTFANEYIYACYTHEGVYKCAYLEWYGRCKVLEGGNFEIKNHE